MAKIPFRTAYGPKLPGITPVIGVSRTRQDSREECDINNIMARFERNGVLEHTRQVQGQYGDYSSGVTFHEAELQVSKAREMFLTLPAQLRHRFGNDPGAFLEFCLDESNAEEMRKLGLMPSSVADAPAKPVSEPVDQTGSPAPQDASGDAGA